jgi:phage replication-related protein YjqB (UPF0714/DUF867 family)
MKATYDRKKNLLRIGKWAEKAGFNVHIQDKNSVITVTAIHGGKIEKMTSEIAQKIAGDRYNCYIIEGMLRGENWEQLHVLSTEFIDPRLEALLSKSATAISIHGYTSRKVAVTVGGNNEILKKLISARLERISIPVDYSTKGIEGASRLNFVNRCKHKGVQLEISSALRNIVHDDLEYFNTSMLLNNLGASIQSAIQEYLSIIGQ